MLNNKSILINGGTGSFGQKCVETILNDYPNVKRIVIYSRGEYRQYQMRERFPESKYPQLRYFIGDIRDAKRLHRACEGIDAIIHAAAINRVDTAEYNPDECIKTNISGSQNVIDAALDCGVQDVVALSSDKACSPINLYGAAKLTSDKLFVAANNIIGRKDIRFSVVRLVEALGAEGSVVSDFKARCAAGAGELPVTDKRMTKFVMSLQEGVDAVLWALKSHMGGEIFIPKVPSCHITDIAEAVAPGVPVVEVGIRPGEKLHEKMINSTDSYNTIDLGKYYAILPSITFNGRRFKEDYIRHYGAKPVPEGFIYSSDANCQWAAADSLKAEIDKL